MNAGVTDKIYYEDFLSDYACPSCQKDFETKLVIYCKAFVLGPVVLWAWGKQGYAECNGCGKVTGIQEIRQSRNSPRYTYTRKGIPFYYYLTTILTGLVLILFSLRAISTIVYNVSTTTEEKLTGMWETEGSGKTLFFFSDHQYTLIQKDTILFGRYDTGKDPVEVHMAVNGQSNTLNKISTDHLFLHISDKEVATFAKSGWGETGRNPYRQEYNQWRLKATHWESASEIKKRVVDYLRYIRIRYEWALENNLTYLPADLYSPVIQAQNGIGLYANSLYSWKPLFYDEGNWRLANTFLHNTFPNGHKLNDQETNVFKRNLEAISAYIQNAEQAAIE